MSKKLFGWLAGIEISVFTILQGSAFTLAIVAPIVFTTLPSRDLAGKVFGNILHVWFWMSLVCAIILLGLAIFSFVRIKPFSRLLLGRLVAVGAIVALELGFAYTLFRLDDITAGLTKPIDDYPKDVNPRLEFDTLHNLSTQLIGVALVFGLVWLVFSVLAVVKLSDNQVKLTSTRQIENATSEQTATAVGV